MRELISYPGIQFYIFQLSGALTVTLKVTNKPTRSFQLHEEDFEDAAGVVKDEEATEDDGRDASAVGLRVTLLKNIGRLEMQYEGRNGGGAIWTFEGLQEVSRAGIIYATAHIQTILPTIVDSGTQCVIASKPRYICLVGKKYEPYQKVYSGTLLIDTNLSTVNWRGQLRGDSYWGLEKRECLIDLEYPRGDVKAEIVEAAAPWIVKTESSDLLPRRYLHLIYRSGSKIKKDLAIEFVDPPTMYESVDADGAIKTTIPDIAIVINALEKCIEAQSTPAT